ncbi:MAG: hypothetical protein HY825_13660 [Acidobacteria bacterium]|nr:hypothetical protein [Acidobacteriota bacterium]
MDQTWWQVVLELVNQWFGLKTIWLPSAAAIATLTGAVQVVKKLMKLAPILDKFTGGWATIILSGIIAGFVVLQPALADGLQVADVIATLLAVLGSAGLYEGLTRLFRKGTATP